MTTATDCEQTTIVACDRHATINTRLRDLDDFCTGLIACLDADNLEIIAIRIAIFTATIIVEKIAVFIVGRIIRIHVKEVTARLWSVVLFFLFVSASHGEGHRRCVLCAVLVTDRVGHSGRIFLTKRKTIKVITWIK